MFKGSAVALITPFNDDFTINEAKLAQLINRQIESGIEAILINGTTSEAQAMTEKECNLALELAVSTIRGRVPLIAGTSANNTDVAIENAKRAEAIGADAILVINPYYNKANDSGMLLHFSKIAKSVTIPVILYNVPGRTGQSIPISIVKELAKIPNIVGIKEASGDIAYLTRLAKEIPKGFHLYCGNDDLILQTYALGGVGVTSVIANVLPKEISQLVDYLAAGDYVLARKSQFEILDFIDALFMEISPSPLKYAMNAAGFDVGPCRLPLGEVTSQTKLMIDTQLEKFKIEDLA